MRAFKDGELVEVTTEEFVQSLYRHANWADEEFKCRSDPAANLGLLMTQAAAKIDQMRAERLKLDKRIRNQRFALRENWMIYEARGRWIGSNAAHRGYVRLLKENRRLRGRDEMTGAPLTSEPLKSNENV